MSMRAEKIIPSAEKKPNPVSNETVKPRDNGGLWKRIRIIEAEITALSEAVRTLRLSHNRVEVAKSRLMRKDEEDLPASIDYNHPHSLTDDELRSMGVKL